MLAIAKSAAVNIEVYVTFQIKFSLAVCLGVELLDHIATLFFLFFEEPPYCYPQ